MRRVCLIVASVALLWAALVVLTGGFSIAFGGIRVSSRSPLNPLLFAVAAFAAAYVLAPRARRLVVLADDLRKGGATAAAMALAVFVLVLGFDRGAHVVGGSDAYGYVSQASVWASGGYRFDEPLIREFAGRLPRDAMVPLGYTAKSGGDGTVVPMYPPGFPMVMAVFARVAGRDAVFAVVPVLAAVAVLATYVMGLRIAGASTGLFAAALLAASPSFLFQLTAAPMSDIPVTAWWALALALLLYDGRRAAFLSGLAASLAILTRPNLVPIALIVFVALLSTTLRDRSIARLALQRAAWFAFGAIPGCLAVGALFWVWYGSPLLSGYGPASGLYAWQNLGPNLLRYPAWVIESETPLVLGAFAAPWLVTRVAHGRVPPAEARPIALFWLCIILAVLASYLLYKPYNAWWFVRFMLPAFPPLLVLTGVFVMVAVSCLSRCARAIVPVTLAAVVAWHGVDYALDHNVFINAAAERKYAVVGGYVARRLPPEAVLLSQLHSGSARYYSGRTTVRFDLLPPAQLEWTLSVLRDAGYRPYFLLESSEVPEFQQLYAGRSPMAALDWPPSALMRESRVRIYDPADREASRAGRVLLTEIVP